MEIIANAVQTVQANQNVLFTDAVVGCSNSLLHRVGSGLVTLKGNTSTQYCYQWRRGSFYYYDFYSGGGRRL